MTPEQVQYIRDRLADWEAVPAACVRDVGLAPHWTSVVDRNGFAAAEQDPAIKVSTSDGRELWSTDDLVRTARHLRVLVDASEAQLSRPEGDADRAWAIAFLGSLALIWSDRPDYPKAPHD